MLTYDSKRFKYVVVPIAATGSSKSLINEVLCKLIPNSKVIRNSDYTRRYAFYVGIKDALYNNKVVFVNTKNHQRLQGKFDVRFIVVDYIADKEVKNQLHMDNTIDIIANGEENGINHLSKDTCTKSEITKIVESFTTEFEKLYINGKDSGFDLVVKLKSDNKEDHVFQYLRIIEKPIAAKYNDFYSGGFPYEAEYREAIESFKDDICVLAVKI